jgi:uncharacterized membrane protein YbhN (UPF0104 family)
MTITCERGGVPDPVRDAVSAPPSRSGGKQIRTALLWVGGAATCGLLGWQLHTVDLSTLGSMRAGWVALVVAAMVLSLLGAAYNLIGFTPTRLPVRRTVAVQTAASFTRVLTPSGMGGNVVNAQYLRRHGTPTPLAVACVAIAQLGQFAMTIVLVALIGLATGSGTGLGSHVPVVAAVLGGLVLLAGALVVVGRRVPRVGALLDGPRASLAMLVDHARRRPLMVAIGLGGSLLLTVALVGALEASVHSFGGNVSLLTVAVVFLTGSAVGSIVPTPGGIGAVESSLIAGLTAAGLASAIAVPAVMLFRLVTVWLPLPIGWASLRSLRRRGHL